MYVLIVYGYGEKRTRRFRTKREALEVAKRIAVRDDCDAVVVRRSRDAALMYEWVHRPREFAR